MKREPTMTDHEMIEAFKRVSIEAVESDKEILALIKRVMLRLMAHEESVAGLKSFNVRLSKDIETLQISIQTLRHEIDVLKRIDVRAVGQEWTATKDRI
jgi:hypothetical protein